MGNITSHPRAFRRRIRRAPATKDVAQSSDEKTKAHGTAATEALQGELPGSPSDSINPHHQLEYDTFLHAYPQFSETAAIDEFRNKEFTRLSKNAVYLDYMGGSQHPESLVKAYTDTLQNNVFGNTHSESTSSQLSERYSQEARQAVLAFFDADPDEYLVVWTANATAGLKLVGESFPFTSSSSLVLPVDAHNSVQGIRAFAGRAGANVRYVSCLKDGGYDLDQAMSILESLPESSGSKSLLALTGLSNLTNHKTPLQAIVPAARARGVYTILDAAALAPTTRISLSKIQVDAMVVSFYKMFGFPTGVGALVAKRSFLDILQRPWFAGGAVDLVQVPGVIATPAECISSRFEEGTLNYMTFPAVSMGLGMLSKYIDLLPVRLSSLYHYLYTELSALRYHDTGTPIVQILTSPPSTPSRSPPHGYVLAFLVVDKKGEIVPLSSVEALAARKDSGNHPAVAPVFKQPRPGRNFSTDTAGSATPGAQTIALRTGCACNPGGAAALLGIESYVEILEPGATHRSFELIVGRELGVVRVSLGWVSNWSDIAAFIAFVKSLEAIVG
ncbi:aminotransferase class-V protein [Ceratobasidium sp. AG-Ba]|nr:aminotransferase class-V protein [Ceratobasidium sp. AG-Ba]